MYGGRRGLGCWVLGGVAGAEGNEVGRDEVSSAGAGRNAGHKCGR